VTPPPDDLPPGVTVTLHEETYAVTGRTVAEVGRSLERNAPAMENRLVRGIHSWNLRWTYARVRREGACHVDGVEVEVVSTVVLPKWTRPAGAPAELVESWEMYLDRLRAHEAHHRELALEGARTLRDRLDELRAPACSAALDDRVHATATEHLEALDRRNRAFDRTAPPLVWPPRDAPLP
jgi:predicted secreted Zn-dependent protease